MGARAWRLAVLRRAPFLARWVRGAGKVLKRHRRGKDLDPVAALDLARRVAALGDGSGGRGGCSAEGCAGGGGEEAREARGRRVQGLCSGMGGLYDVSWTTAEGRPGAFVAKLVRPPAREGPGSAEDKRDRDSYSAEASFYEGGHARRLRASGAACPEPLLVDRAADGSLLICMSRLPGREHERLGAPQVRATLTWLARLHALFWGAARADAAVESGLQPQGCFWHLGARRRELAAMPRGGVEGRLCLAARGLDARLKADVMQTICHGDAKDANILVDERGDVALVDFQWTGKAPPSKDLAYCLMCAAGTLSAQSEEAYLLHYHAELARLLEAQNDPPPLLQDLRTSYSLAVCDLGRWMSGWAWWGNIPALYQHISRVLHRLDGGTPLASEEAYSKALFSVFPPAGEAGAGAV